MFSIFAIAMIATGAWDILTVVAALGVSDGILGMTFFDISAVMSVVIAVFAFMAAVLNMAVGFFSFRAKKGDKIQKSKVKAAMALAMLSVLLGLIILVLYTLSCTFTAALLVGVLIPVFYIVSGSRVCNRD